MLAKIVLRLRGPLALVLLAGASWAFLGSNGSATPTASSAARQQQIIPSGSLLSLDQKRVCVHSQSSTILELTAFARFVHRQTVDCSMVYNTPRTWTQWVDPWFVTSPDPQLNWARWVRASPRLDPRQLVISQPLIPAGLAHSAWRAPAAQGRFATYARRLAQNLVAAGLGNSVIRLAWEANGTWTVDNVGHSDADVARWVAFWRRTVTAMRSVPGAHFAFDWCINNGYRAIPFSRFYPGNRYVDIIGDDAFDAGVPAGQNYWSHVLNQAGGLAQLVAFAKAEGKPISIPEWGVGDWRGPNSRAGDDAQYVNGIARIVHDDDVAYQSYFFSRASATALVLDPRSRAAYRAAFGDGGSATGIDDGTDDLSRQAGSAG